MSLIHLIGFSQVIASAEESLKDFEERITELKTRGSALHADQISTNKLLKLQVTYMIDGSRRNHQFGFTSECTVKKLPSNSKDAQPETDFLCFSRILMRSW